MVFTKSKFALSSDGNTLYLLNGDIIIIKDRRTGAQRRIPLPVGFPEISWASDLAYDTSRNILSLISFGGEGFFYRFDTKNEKWIDYYSMKNIDVKALAYDSGLDKYLAWANPGLLLFLSPDGQLLSKHKLTEILPGFKRLASDYEVPILRVIPNAKNIGMVAFDHNDSVKYIWYYSVDSQKALLTYKSQ
ncbi:MAG TPA: hypothetical protein VHO90_03865 [Bacteroidales bacterium]|nr:hypothetical protein [Bacteroidales bacterium]